MTLYAYIEIAMKARGRRKNSGVAECGAIGLLEA
jgi:hypothetical protein